MQVIRISPLYLMLLKSFESYRFIRLSKMYGIQRIMLSIAQIDMDFHT